MSNTYTSLINKHVGENAFIIGAGPSIWYHSKNPLFSKLYDFGLVVSVNSSVILFPEFNYWISNDSLCLRWSWWNLVKKGKGIKVVRNSWDKYKKEIEGFLSFDPRPTSEDVINPNDIGLCYCSSVPSAIDLSLQMGCKKIFLFGVDHAKIDGKSHFWQFYEKHKQPICFPHSYSSWENQVRVFDINNQSFESLKKFSIYKNSAIFNVTISINGKKITKVGSFNTIVFDDFKDMILIK